MSSRCSRAWRRPRCSSSAPCPCSIVRSAPGISVPTAGRVVLANVGNLIQAIYVYSLPAGPIWLLHAFYLVASALMLGLHLRHTGRHSAPPRPPSRLESPERDLTLTQGCLLYTSDA